MPNASGQPERRLLAFFVLTLVAAGSMVAIVPAAPAVAADPPCSTKAVDDGVAYTVPSGVSKVRITSYGEAGEGGISAIADPPSRSGGAGSMVVADVAVSAGQVLQPIRIDGGAKGARGDNYNGQMPDGPRYGAYGTHGGAARGVVRLQPGCRQFLVVAGGGGGNGSASLASTNPTDPDGWGRGLSSTGGAAGLGPDTPAGGGQDGHNGRNDQEDGAGGGGATLTSGGGGGGGGYNALSACPDGDDGGGGGFETAGAGAKGQDQGTCDPRDGAGGGGGGYYGGGGGGGHQSSSSGSGAGGGGSSYVIAGASNVSYVSSGSTQPPGPTIQPIYTAPAAPTNVTAVPHHQRADVTFTAAPATGVPIASYTISSTPGGFTTSVPATGTLKGTVTGLTNGTDYRFSVVAVPEATALVEGTAASSALSNSVEPAFDPPTAVRNAVAVGGDGKVTLSWDPPADLGGTPIMNYRLTCDCSSGNALLLGDTTSFVAPGATNGKPIAVTIIPLGAGGQGPGVVVSATPSAGTRPGKPGTPVATAGNGFADVRFKPAEQGDDLFTVTTSPAPTCGAITTMDGYAYGAGAQVSVRVPCLVNGTAYTFTVTTRNNRGTSDPSDRSAAVTPHTTAPERVLAEVVPGVNQVDVKINSVLDGGSPITSITAYAVNQATDERTTVTVPVTGSLVLPTSITVPGLEKRVLYTFYVSLSNAMGTLPDQFVGYANAIGIPDAPSQVNAHVPNDPQGGKVTVGFQVTQDGACGDYVVTAMPGNITRSGSTGFGNSCVGTNLNSTTFDGLTNGTEYTFSVHLVDAQAGAGPESASSDPVAPYATTVPEAPSNVVATSVGTGKVRLTFDPPPANWKFPVTSYRVGWGGGVNDERTFAGSATSGTISGLTNGQDYSFTIAAENARGFGPDARSNSVTPVSLPTPTGVRATAGNAAALVSFDPVQNNAGGPLTYVVTFDDPQDQDDVPVTATTAESPVLVTGLSNDISYDVTVHASNDGGNSPESAQITVRPSSQRPTAPTNVTATAGIGQATITFDRATVGSGASIVNYIVTAHPGGQTLDVQFNTYGTDPITTTMSGLDNGTTYTFSVHARSNSFDGGDGLESDPSNPVTPNLLVQDAMTLTPTSGTYGDLLDLSAHGGSGFGQVGQITASGDACAIAAGKLVLTHATTAGRTCTISVTKAGDFQYAAVTTDQVVTIARAALTVTAGNQQTVYGNPFPTTVEYSAFISGDGPGSLDGTLDFSGPATTTPGVGTAKLTPGGLTSDDYAIDFEDGTVTVTPRPVMVSAKQATKVYGEDNPPLSAEVEDNLVGDDELDYALITSATRTSPPGGYPITVVPGVNPNYQVLPVDGGLHVGPAPLRIEADDLQVPFGDPPPFTVTAAGLVQPDTLASLTGTLDYQVVDPAGPHPDNTYDIVPSGLISPKYDIEYVNGTLTRTKRASTITWADPAPVVYGAALTATQLGATVDVPGTLTYSPDLGTVLHAGVRDLTVSFVPADPDTFLASSKTVQLTVTKAPLTITADDATKVYGQPNPGFIVSYGPFTNGDTTSSLSGSPAFSTPAGPASAAGDYPVTPSGLTSPDYAISYVDGTLKVSKATPTVTWADPSSIGYGTALSGTQLTATGSVPGTLTYSPAAGTVLHAGPAQALTATFVPDDAANYQSTSKTVHLDVAKAPLTVTADDATKVYGDSNPAFDVSYGPFRNGDAASSLSGTLAFSTSADSSSPVDEYPITPSGLTSPDYAISYVDGTLRVTKAATTVTWADPAAIGYGTPLSATQLAATAPVPGTFTYSPAAGSVLHAGTRDLTVSFVPDNAVDYSSTSKTVHLDVAKAPLTVTADDATKVYGDSNPAFDVSYGQLRNGDAASSLSGTLDYSTSADSSSPVGEYPITPSGLTSPDYAISYVDGTLRVTKAATTVTWADPASIGYGTALSATQLDATASVPGTFTYSPDSGTVLPAGSDRELTVEFVPDNAADYRPSSRTVHLDVSQATPALTWADPAPIEYGTPLSAMQLDATASVPGTFTYSPALGTVLHAGTGRELEVTFVPQDGDNYRSTSTTVHLEVTKAPLTITADDATKTYGQANPGFDATFGTFQAGDSASALNGTLAFTTPADSSSPVGGYPIVPAGLSSPDYEISYADGTLRVTRATPSLSWADPAPIRYGTALSAAQLDATASVPGTFTYSPGPGTVLHAGAGRELVVVFVPDDGANYVSTSTTAHLDVTRADLTVTVEDAEKTYGHTNPAFALTYGPFQAGDTASSLQGAVRFRTTGTTSPVGGYPIVASGLTSSDYAITYVDGTLRITPAATTVTWADPAPIVYGTALTPTQLNATASVPGALTYSPSLGTLLHAGSGQRLVVTFVPADTVNFVSTSKTVQLDVVQAPLTVTTKDATRTFGDVNPEFAVKYGAFRAGDSAASLNGALAFSTSAGPTSPVGGYRVAASGLSSPDYAISFVDGTLRVTRSKVVIAATGVSLDRSDKARKIRFTATVTSATTGASVSGVKVTFTITKKNGNTLGCTDMTGAAGMATCRSGAVRSSAFPRSSTIAVGSAPTRNLASGTETAKLTVR